MNKFFEETMQGLLEAVAIDKGEISLANYKKELNVKVLENIVNLDKVCK